MIIYFKWKIIPKNCDLKCKTAKNSQTVTAYEWRKLRISIFRKKSGLAAQGKKSFFLSLCTQIITEHFGVIKITYFSFLQEFEKQQSCMFSEM
jgi:hypothetical protein